MRLKVRVDLIVGIADPLKLKNDISALYGRGNRCYLLPRLVNSNNNHVLSCLKTYFRKC